MRIPATQAIKQATSQAAEEWLETRVKPRIDDNLRTGRGVAAMRGLGSSQGLRSRTGELANAITVGTEAGSAGVKGFVYVSGKEQSKIARIWEFTGHKEIKPKAGRPYSSGEYDVLSASSPRSRLRFRIGGPISGSFVFAKRIRAQRPRPFIRPAIEHERSSYGNIAFRHYREAVIASLAGPRGK